MLDTLTIARRLTEAGLEPTQANAIVAYARLAHELSRLPGLERRRTVVGWPRRVPRPRVRPPGGILEPG